MLFPEPIGLLKLIETLAFGAEATKAWFPSVF